jgi:hypothetical protein
MLELLDVVAAEDRFAAGASVAAGARESGRLGRLPPASSRSTRGLRAACSSPVRVGCVEPGSVEAACDDAAPAP